MTRPHPRLRLVTAVVFALVLTLPGVALAGEKKTETPEVETPEAETTEVETTTEEAEELPVEVTSVLSTLPVLGSGLDVTITRDDDGAIESVALDPNDGATTTKENDHRVVFLLGDGDTEVIVKSVRGFTQTKVKADSTADVAGSGAWSADVFGTGTVTIPYSVSFDGVTPTIAVNEGSIVTPGDVTVEIGEGKTKTSDDEDHAFYSLRVKLSSGDQTAVLKLRAKVRVTEEGETKVSVSATLSSRDRVKCHLGDRRGDRDRVKSDSSERDGDDDKIEGRRNRSQRVSDAGYERSDGKRRGSDGGKHGR